MNNTPSNMEEVLSEQICGLHQYRLQAPARLSYVSRDLCRLLGLQAGQLLEPSRDAYAQQVHPEDRERYAAFLQQAARAPGSYSCRYRLLGAGGETLSVLDSLRVRPAEEGALVGTSVLTLLPRDPGEEELRLWQQALPCGILRYTCEAQPRVTYLNEKMVEILRFPPAREGEMDYLELYRSNIFLMIPMEERRRFAKFLNRVYSSESPVAGEITLLRCDGTRARIFGWVAKHVNEEGQEEFQSVCMDITERYRARQLTENRRYLRALADVYSKIFEFDLDANTVKCLHCQADSSFKKFENLPIRIDEAVENWLLLSVAEENRQALRDFFRRFCQKRLYDPEERPAQISYEARAADGSLRRYQGMFIKIDEAVSFYCCRQIQNDPGAQALKLENDQLREGMRDLVLRFSDGIAAFEVSPEGCVKPLYASENVCEFFGYTKEEWLPLTQRFTPLESFVAYSEAPYEAYAQLLRSGEAEFSYFDYKTETERRIKAICSQKEAGGLASRYVMLYAVEDGGREERRGLAERRGVSIRTFGYFDVFVGDRPIAFRNKKSRELFALLVDRRGGYVTSEEAIGYLWEDEPANAVTLARYRKVALRLKSTLEEYGIADVIEAVDGKRRLVMEKVQCDLYDYLSGKEEHAQLFKGSYLSNYSWGETTLGQLLRDAEGL